MNLWTKCSRSKGVLEEVEQFRTRLEERISITFLKSIVLDKIAESLKNYWNQSTVRLNPPFPQIELHVDRETSILNFARFRSEVKEKGIGNLSERTMDELAFELEGMSAFALRTIALQRFTPASLTGEEYLPRAEELMEQSSRAFNEQEISVAARALMKHGGRHEFWGKVVGSADQKNKIALRMVTNILLNSTWWNQYYHFRHGAVLEFRIISGHGVRWGDQGFIGFVEPFVD